MSSSAFWVKRTSVTAHFIVEQGDAVASSASSTMGIYNVFIVSKSGGLIYHHDRDAPPTEIEKTFGFPLDIKLKVEGIRVCVAFGQRDGICVGHSLLAFNGKDVEVQGGKATVPAATDGGGSRDLFEALADRSSYPLNLKFGRPKVTTNEKIVLASMFYPLYALAVQLSPETGSSGIQVQQRLVNCEYNPLHNNVHFAGVGD